MKNPQRPVPHVHIARACALSSCHRFQSHLGCVARMSVTRRASSPTLRSLEVPQPTHRHHVLHRRVTARGPGAPTRRTALRFAAAARIAHDRHCLLPAVHGRRSGHIRCVSTCSTVLHRLVLAAVDRRILWRVLAATRPDTRHGVMAPACRTRGRRPAGLAATYSRESVPDSCRCVPAGLGWLWILRRS